MERIARIVNLRVFFVTAIFAIFSTVFAVYLPTLISAIVIILAIILLLTLGIVYIKKEDAVKSITAFLCLLVVFFCSVSSTITISSWTCDIDQNTEYLVCGKIKSVNKSGYSTDYVLTEISTNNVSKNGNIYLRVLNGDGVTINFLREGDIIKFNSTLDFYSLMRESIDGYRYRNNIRYGTSIDESDIKFVKSAPTFLDNLKHDILSALNESMGEYGSIAFGMLIGEKGYIDDVTVDTYSVSGLGHILAVSGLHIGFIVLVLAFILNKLKANRFVKLGVISVLLTLYCFIASFSSSVVRATIMCVVGLVADAFSQRRDTLNSLSLAVSVMLIIKPLYLFDVGFLMSVSAVYGIVLFSRSFDKFFNMFLPKFIAKPLSVSLSAQIGITPITLITFSSFSTYSVLTNLLLIPLITVAFIAISIAVIFVLLFPSLSVVLTIAGLPLALVDTIANLIAYLPIAKITVFASGLLFSSYILFFVVSEYFALPKFKTFASIACITLIVVQLIVYNVPLSRDFDVTAVCAYKSVSTVIRNESGVTIVGDCDDYYSLDNALTNLREGQIDTVIANKVDDKTAKTLIKLKSKFGNFKVYCSTNCDYSSFNLLAQNDIPFYVKEYIDCVDGIDTIYYEGKFIGYGYKVENSSLLMLGYGVNTSKLPVTIINEYAIIRSYVYGGDYADRIYVVNYDNSYEYQVPRVQFGTKNNMLSFVLKTGEKLTIAN